EEETGAGGSDGHEHPCAVEVALRGERAAAGKRNERGEAERGPDLTKGLLHTDPGGETSGWKSRRGERGQRRQHQADPDSADDGAGQVIAEIVRLIVEPAQEPDARDREEDPTGRADPRAPEAIREPAGQARDDRGRERAGQKCKSGPGDRVVPDVGQEENVAEQQHREGGEEEERTKRRERERRGP